MSGRAGTASETHPLLANYVERQLEREENPESERSSEITFLRWTTCDEIRRCSCAVLSFMLMAALVGSGLVLFWFLWAWFVLYLDLPGVLTPIVWLAGFLLPLCIFKLLQSCPRCTRACFAQPLLPPDINAWKTHHLWNERRQFILVIESITPLPRSVCEMVSDFCFHRDILVTTNGNKLVGIYPDTAQLHTVAEFSKNITDLAVCNGNIHCVYVLMCRESASNAMKCDCSEGDDDTTINNSIGDWIPSLIWSSPSQCVDMMICSYDIASGLLVDSSLTFAFEQISLSTMQQLGGIYYSPSYRLLIDTQRDILVVHRDGDFVMFDSVSLQQIGHRRAIIGHPENRDDREQFVHLREYRWNASRIVPPRVVEHILRIVDEVEGTVSTAPRAASDVYVVIPFGAHALFITNICTGWLRYLDFSHVDLISDTSIHYVEFSIDSQYLYLCCSQTLSVLSTHNFEALITVPFTKLDYTMPCGLVRTPPNEDQILLMLSKHRHKSSQESYKTTLSKKLESIAVIFASTRIFMDPRIFLYRFPDNKSRVVSHGNGKHRSVYSKGSFLIDRVMSTNEAASNGSGAGRGQQWHYISLKQQRPWNHTSTSPTTKYHFVP
eukprot:60602_1